MPSARRLPVIITALLPMALWALAACSSSPSSSSPTTVATTTTANTGGAKSTTAAAAPATGYLPTTTLGPTTTFMHDCSQMPTVADLAKLVGVPLIDGSVTGPGTCQYNALNTTGKFLLLSLLTRKDDIATFADLQTSLGASKPLAVKGVKGVLVGLDHSVYVTMNHNVYVVRANITKAPPAKQVPLSAKVLQRWVQL